MIYEYVTNLINLLYSDKKDRFVKKIKEKMEFRKIKKYINSNNSNYELLVDLANVMQVMISMFGQPITLHILEPTLISYHAMNDGSITTHLLTAGVSDDNYKYDIDITYITVKDLDQDKVVNYTIEIYDEIYRVTKGYSYSSDMAYKHKELNDLVSALLRIVIMNLIISIRNYIYDNQLIM